MANKTILDRTQPPQAGPLHKIPFPEVHASSLKNGIPVHHVRFGPEDLLVVYAVFNAGKGFESKAGQSTMVARMMTEGTKNHSALSLGQALDFYGLQLNVNGGFEQSTVEMTTLTKHMRKAVPLMAEIIREATFPEQEFDQLKSRTLQRLEVQEQKTDYQARKLFSQQIFSPNHPYGRVQGKAGLEALQLENLTEFYQSHYALNNLYFIVVGQVPEAEFMPLLEESFGDAKLETMVGPPVSKADLPLPDKITGRHFIELPDAMQSTVRVGHHGFARNHPDYQAMSVVNTVLGGYFGSRLMRNIREERGYTYGIGSGWLSMKYNGLFVVQTDVGNGYVEDTLTQIKHEINLLREKGVSADELSLVKNYMLGSLISSRETPRQIAGTLRNLMVNGVSLDKLNEKFDVIQAITPEQVKELANRWLHPDALLEVIAGGKPE